MFGTTPAFGAPGAFGGPPPPAGTLARLNSVGDPTNPQPHSAGNALGFGSFAAPAPGGVSFGGGLPTSLSSATTLPLNTVAPNRVRYAPTTTHTAQGASETLVAITAMDAYASVTFEELRWADYQLRQGGAALQGAGGASQAAPAPAMFGAPAPAAAAPAPASLFVSMPLGHHDALPSHPSERDPLPLLFMRRAWPLLLPLLEDSS